MIAHWGRLRLPGAARRLRGPDLFRFALLGLSLALVTLFVVSAVFFKERTFVIEARTTALELTFTGDSNDWYLGSATICRLRSQPDLRQQSGTAGCDGRFYDIDKRDEFTIGWPAGAEVRATLSEDGVLTLATENDRFAEFPQGTLIVAPATSWREIGALTFSAQMLLGTPMSAGERFLMSGGRWEAREAGLATGLLRANVTEVIKSGELVRGGTASVWLQGEPAQMFGHITPGAALDGQHLELVAISTAGDVELRLSYFGASAPAIVRPDLIDVAISSPLLLAMAVILSVLASITQVYADLASRWSTQTRTAPTAPEQANSGNALQEPAAILKQSEPHGPT